MMPINVLEAMAAGLPVVGSRIWGVEDAVEHGVNGYLVEPGSASEFADRLAQFGHDVELGKAFGSKAMEIVRSRFSAAAVWQQYEAAFQELGVISRRCGIH
jgi:glycosyltransferase involved in cell wall biosynthesis